MLPSSTGVMRLLWHSERLTMADQTSRSPFTGKMAIVLSRLMAVVSFLYKYSYNFHFWRAVTAYLYHPQVTYWPMLSHQNLVLSILTRMSSGQRDHIMELIYVLLLPMKLVTPLDWVILSSEAPWWHQSTLVTVPTSDCILMMWEAFRRYMVSLRRRSNKCLSK